MDRPRHRFYVPPDRIDDGRVRFTADQARQLASVLRRRPGDGVRVFDGTAPTDYLVDLTVVTHVIAEGRIRGTVDQPGEPRTRLHAYPSLLSRDKFEQVLQKLVEVGAAAVTPVLTARSLVRQAPEPSRHRRWQAIMREAAEQSGRAAVPVLHTARELARALAEARAAGPALLADEGEQRLGVRAALRDLPREGPLALFVGPEGGYAPEEVALAREAGARVVSLGPRILRTETASPVFAALVLYELGDV